MAAELNGNGASLADFIWKNADDLWGPFQHVDFGRVILPFTLLRRLECVIEPTREKVLAEKEKHKRSGVDLALVLRRASKLPFYNTSKYSLGNLGSGKTRQNLNDYVAQFSDNARVIFEQFDFTNTVSLLDKAGLLYKICNNFAAVDLHPNKVPDRVMSNLYEHLIRRFGAEVNEGAEDFMTPRDVVHLATTLLLDPDDDLFESKPGLIRTIYDPTCGTGGFLSDAMNHVEGFAKRGKSAPVLIPHGQELNPPTHAVALAGMLLRQLPNEPSRDLSQNIKLGSTLSNDQFAGHRFNYCLANPPFGKKWEMDQKAVEAEHKNKGFAGRFGPGLPRINDGSMLFLLHLARKLELPKNGGGRAAIVLSGSPLFNGGAGSGESEIRRWLLESDLVEAIVALPTEIFFRTGIGTYLWVLSNKKPKERQGKVQLINATGLWTSMKNEGNKRRKISDEQIREISTVYADFEETEISKIMESKAFGYRRIRVLRPLCVRIVITNVALERLRAEAAWQALDKKQQAAWEKAFKPLIGEDFEYNWVSSFAEKTAENDVNVGRVRAPLVKAMTKAFSVANSEADPVRDADGDPVADPDLTDYENIPLPEDISTYLKREVLPHVPDAYLDAGYQDAKDHGPGVVGYEINFNRYFYKYLPPRKLSVIDKELKAVEKEIAALLDEVAE